MQLRNNFLQIPIHTQDSMLTLILSLIQFQVVELITLTVQQTQVIGYSQKKRQGYSNKKKSLITRKI